MGSAKAYIGRNATWLASAMIAGVGFSALELLKASQLFDEGATDVPLWAWMPLIVMCAGGVATLISVFLCKSKTARMARLFVVVFFVAMIFKYTVGFVVFS